MPTTLRYMPILFMPKPRFSKTELITFSRKRTNNKLFDPFKINHHEIKPKSAVNYLGITLDSRLNFKLNIKNKLIKANNAIRTIYPLIKRNSKLSTENKIILYKALLRPIITYAAPVWSHLSDFALEPLEIFQNKCMRLIHNVPRYTNTQYLRDLSELPKIHTDTNRKILQKYTSTNKNTKRTRLTTTQN
jgi:hypothetical protein